MSSPRAPQPAAAVPLAPSPPSPTLAGAPSTPASLRSTISLQPTRHSRHAHASASASAAGSSSAQQQAPHEADEAALGAEENEHDSDSERESLVTPLMRRRIDVGAAAWDDSDDDEDDAYDSDEHGGAPLALSRSRDTRRQRRERRQGGVLASSSGGSRLGAGGAPESYFSTLRHSSRAREWLRILTLSPAAEASLSAPHVSANLFASSLHPGVLLSMPHYFSRTGTAAGIVGLVVVAILGGAGGGLWVVLSRYVKGKTVEGIVGESCGKSARWKGALGRAVSGALLAGYATGAAVLAYFALADLLLQLLFHYSPRGIPLHDRAFVTFVVGGLLTTPLVIFPLAKRTLIRLSTNLAVLLYPILIGIVLSKIYTLPPSSSSSPPLDALPNFNPLLPPSVWAPYSLLPLLTLSSSPLQILAHNRSLRRKGLSGSNVAAFFGAQAGQVLCVVGVSVAFGIGAGTKGIGERLGEEIHPNLFASLPTDDHLLNLARALFILVLSSHLALCLATARSSWGRLLWLFNLNPLRRRLASHPPRSAPSAPAPRSATSSRAAGRSGSGTGGAGRKPPRAWGKLARNALAGLLLWALTAAAAYFSGVGGLRRSEKQGEEARFSRGSEVLGLMGAAVGFVCPALVWIIVFFLRRPRAILPPFATALGRTASAWFMGPLGMLARRRLPSSSSSSERAPLLPSGAAAPPSADAEDPSTRAFRAALAPPDHATQAASVADADPRAAPSWSNEGRAASNDDATRILLARKERQMQKRTRSRRLYQDIIVLVGILPLGVALIVLGSLDLSHGGW